MKKKDQKERAGYYRTKYDSVCDEKKNACAAL
jgi:hypothetical protein